MNFYLQGETSKLIGLNVALYAQWARPHYIILIETRKLQQFWAEFKSSLAVNALKNGLNLGSKQIHKLQQIIKTSIDRSSAYC
jgi:hypothetical protein